MSRLDLTLGGLLLFSLYASAFARTINVPADEQSIQAAIDAAVDGDEIGVQPERRLLQTYRTRIVQLLVLR